MSFGLLVGVAFKGTVIVAVAWFVAWCLRRRSAAARHLVWTAAAGALVALPVLSMAVPAWRLPRAMTVDTGMVFRVFSAVGEQSANAGLSAGRDGGVPRRPGGLPHTARLDPRLAVAAVWGVGTLIGLFEMLVAYGRLWRVRRSARASAAAHDARELAASMGIGRSVPVLEIPNGMPAAFGCINPAVLLPEEANAWSEERRRLVLLHEFAHVRRSDPATHLLARAAVSLYWWNPLVWVTWREFLKERERAADDLVLNAGARASDYAGHLLEIARTLRAVPASAGAAVAMARRSQLEGRLLMILDSNVNRKAAARMAPFAAAALAAALVAPFAAVRAQDPAQPVAPEVEAAIRAAMAQKNSDMLDEAAAIYARQRKYAEAQKLLETALQIRGDTAGVASGSYATGLVKLADLAMRRYGRKEAEALYTQAVSLGDRPEVVPALLALGMGAKDADQAFPLFERALQADFNGPHAGRALMWMAIARQRQGRAVEAEQLFNDAIAKQGANSPAAGNALEAYSLFLHEQGRQAEADAMHLRAQDAWKAYKAEAAASSGGYVFRARAGGSGAPAAAAQPALKAGGPVSGPQLLYKVEPQYSEEARAMKYQGSVVVSVEVGPDGLAHNARIVRGLGFGLDEKAIEAIEIWRFKPGEKDGQPVTVAAIIEVNFRLL